MIHSVHPAGALVLPWQLEGLRQAIAFNFAAAYAVLAGLVALLSLQRRPAPAD